MNDFAKFFDHTLLKPDATRSDIRELCREAADLNVWSVCVNSTFVADARAFLDEAGAEDIKVCSVVGFPLGASSSAAKAFEAAQAIRDGADEIDMVIAIGAVKAEDWDAVKKDVAVVRAVMDAEAPGKVLKVILETGLLTDVEIGMACENAIEGGADFLKTSTGFGYGGAEAETVSLMRDMAAGRAKIKASGGIRDLKTALEMIEAGADRIGASSTAAILKELAEAAK